MEITDEFIRDLNTANFTVHRRDGTIPVYLARATAGGELMTFWCPACKRPHWHGLFAGPPSHYVAHCREPFHPAGYYVALVPLAPAAAPRALPVGDVFPRYPATA